MEDRARPRCVMQRGGWTRHAGIGSLGGSRRLGGASKIMECERLLFAILDKVSSPSGIDVDLSRDRFWKDVCPRNASTLYGPNMKPGYGPQAGRFHEQIAKGLTRCAWPDNAEVVKTSSVTKVLEDATPTKPENPNLDSAEEDSTPKPGYLDSNLGQSEVPGQPPPTRARPGP